MLIISSVSRHTHNNKPGERDLEQANTKVPPHWSSAERLVRADTVCHSLTARFPESEDTSVSGVGLNVGRKAGEEPVNVLKLAGREGGRYATYRLAPVSNELQEHLRVRGVIEVRGVTYEGQVGVRPSIIGPVKFGEHFALSVDGLVAQHPGDAGDHGDDPSLCDPATRHMHDFPVEGTR